MEMTHKSHLALILPIAIRGPRETKNSKQIFEFPWDTNPTASGLLTDLQKTSLFYYIYHYEVSNVIMQTVNNVGCKAYRLWGLKGLAGFFGSSLASGNEELPRVAKEYCLFDFLSLIFRAPSLNVFCWPQHCTFLDQFHRDFNINNLNFFFSDSLVQILMPPLPPESPLLPHPTFFELLSQDLDIERLY